MAIAPESRKIPLYLFIILIFLVTGITFGGNIYLNTKIADIKKGTEENLASVAYLKVARVKTWWDERLADADVIFNDNPMIGRIQEFLESKPGQKADDIKKDILTWMSAIKNSANYEDVALLDRNGTIKLAVDREDRKIGTLTQRFVSEALRTKNIAATDLYRHDIYEGIYIDILIPLLPSQNKDAPPIGVVLLRINPNQFLYPLIQYWPTQSPTSETLLVRKEGDYVLFLNELRHKKHTALSMKLPINQPKLPAAIAASGLEGVLEGIDYRGVKVLAVIENIPNTSWHLVAKVDEKEAYYPIKRETLRVCILAFLLVIISIAFIALVWNRQVMRFYRVQYEIEARRVKMEQALCESSEEWARTFNAVPDLIFIQDKNNSILRANKALLDILDMDPEEIIGKKYYDIIKKIGKPWPGCPLDVVKIDSVPQTEEVSDQATGLSFLVSTTPLFDDKGELIGAVHISRNITDRKKTEKDLWEAKEGLERTNKELRQLDQLKSDFISTVSHELRTPLAIIKEGMSLLLDKIPGEMNEKQSKILDVSKHNIDRLSRIINSLLDISKIEAGKVGLKKGFISMPDMIKHIALSFENKIRQKGLELKLDIDKSEDKLYADADRIAQVMTNLLDNAIKFTEKGCVEIAYKDKNDTIECSVADTGTGIDKNDLPKVFNKFQQFGRVAGAGEKGTGLGLSIAKSIIDMHHGTMTVESELGKGTKFTFRLHKYTPENLFKECADEAVKNAVSNNSKTAIIMISSGLVGAKDAEAPVRKINDVMTEAARHVKNTLRRKGDDVIKNNDETMVILADCSKENSLKVMYRVEEILQKYLFEHEVLSFVKLRFTAAAYPDDAPDGPGLVAKARAAFNFSKKT